MVVLVVWVVEVSVAQEYIGGFAGASFPATGNRLVLGGGGGAGTTNDDQSRPLRNGLASSGTAGGGMAFIRTGSVSGSGAINANGLDAFDTRVDGAGGGGAGGTVVVSSANNNLTGLAVTANGGRGGNALANEPSSMVVVVVVVLSSPVQVLMSVQMVVHQVRQATL